MTRTLVTHFFQIPRHQTLSIDEVGWQNRDLTLPVEHSSSFPQAQPLLSNRIAGSLWPATAAYAQLVGGHVGCRGERLIVHRRIEIQNWLLGAH